MDRKPLDNLVKLVVSRYLVPDQCKITFIEDPNTNTWIYFVHIKKDRCCGNAVIHSPMSEKDALKNLGKQMYYLCIKMMEEYNE